MGEKGKQYRLTAKKQRFIDAYVAGNSAAAAARMAGYAESTARQWAYRLLTEDDRVKAEVERLQAETRERNAITVDSMVKQLEEDRQFARETENTTAAVRASEIKAKLSGLLHDKVKVEATVTHNLADDLDAAWERVRQGRSQLPDRAANAIDVTPREADAA